MYSSIAELFREYLIPGERSFGPSEDNDPTLTSMLPLSLREVQFLMEALALAEQCNTSWFLLRHATDPEYHPDTIEICLRSGNGDTAFLPLRIIGNTVETFLWLATDFIRSRDAWEITENENGIYAVPCRPTLDMDFDQLDENFNPIARSA